MALTRKTLKAMELTEEQVESIIEAHTETLMGLKEELDRVRAEAEKVPTLQKELDDANERLAAYDELKNEFDTYKADIKAREARTAKETAYREILKSVGVSDKRIDAILRVTDLDGMELDDDGKLKEPDKLSETAKTEWADFITQTEPPSTDAPRIDTGGSLNPGSSALGKADILKIKDTTERQRAWTDYIKTQKGI